MLRSKDIKAQGALEYILLFAAVIIFTILVLKPNGFVTRAVDDSLNTSVIGLQTMASSVTLNVYNGF